MSFVVASSSTSSSSKSYTLPLEEEPGSTAFEENRSDAVEALESSEVEGDGVVKFSTESAGIAPLAAGTMSSSAYAAASSAKSSSSAPLPAANSSISSSANTLSKPLPTASAPSFVVSSSSSSSANTLSKPLPTASAPSFVVSSSSSSSTAASTNERNFSSEAVAFFKLDQVILTEELGEDGRTSLISYLITTFNSPDISIGDKEKLRNNIWKNNGADQIAWLLYSANGNLIKRIFALRISMLKQNQGPLEDIWKMTIILNKLERDYENALNFDPAFGLEQLYNAPNNRFFSLIDSLFFRPEKLWSRLWPSLLSIIPRTSLQGVWGVFRGDKPICCFYKSDNQNIWDRLAARSPWNKNSYLYIKRDERLWDYFANKNPEKLTQAFETFIKLKETMDGSSWAVQKQAFEYVIQELLRPSDSEPSWSISRVKLSDSMKGQVNLIKDKLLKCLTSWGEAWVKQGYQNDAGLNSLFSALLKDKSLRDGPRVDIGNNKFLRNIVSLCLLKYGICQKDIYDEAMSLTIFWEMQENNDILANHKTAVEESQIFPGFISALIAHFMQFSRKNVGGRMIEETLEEKKVKIREMLRFLFVTNGLNLPAIALKMQTSNHVDVLVARRLLVDKITGHWAKGEHDEAFNAFIELEDIRKGDNKQPFNGVFFS